MELSSCDWTITPGAMLGSMVISVRAARVEDGPAQQRIEIAAGKQFLEVDLPEIAGDEPLPLVSLAEYANEGRAWTAVDEGNYPLGYVLVSIVDGLAHIDQVSVSPDVQRQGIGRALIEQVAQWATRRGMTGITLTTFASVPWNRPLYERLGFRVISDAEIARDLRALRKHEADLGLDSNLRVCMRRDLA
jgi:GNAT superfamily N-acetyltransferase